MADGVAGGPPGREPGAARTGLGRVVRLVCRSLDVPVAAVAVARGDRFRIVASEGCPFDEVPRDGSLPGCTLDAGRTSVIDDLARTDPPSSVPVIDGRPIRFYAGVPIRGPEGDLVGVLCAADFTPRSLDPAAIARFEDLAALAGDQLLLVRELAEHRRLLTALRESEQRFRDFAEVASDWFWETDAELRFTWLSETVFAKLGVRPEWHYGKTRLELAATEDARAAVRAIHEIMLRREPFFDAEYQYRCPAGVRWLRISGRPVFDSNGRFLGYRGTGRDITRLKEQEQRIREVEERYRRLVELSPDGVVVKDAGHRIRFANPAAAAIFGFDKPVDLIGRRTIDFYRREVHGEVDRVTEQLIAEGGAAPRAELEVVRPDGGTRVVEAVAARIEEGGELLVLVVLRDVTERKRAERQLRESEQRFRDFAEVASDWFWEMDAELRFTWLSDAVRRLFGVAPEWHYGKTRLELAADEEARAVAQRVQELMERREPFTDVEYLRRGPTGDHWLRISGKPVFDATGRFLGYRGTGRDVTQLRRAEAARREAEERYRALVELSPDPVVLVADGRFVFANGPAARLFGVDEPARLVGRSIYEFVAPEDHGRIRERHAAPLEPGESLPPIEIIVVQPDGGRVEIEAKGSAIVHEGRRMLLGVLRDVGARKAAERALREAEERYRRLFESAPVGILLYRDGRYVHANRAAAAILGAASPDELVGRDPFDLILEPYHEAIRTRAARMEAGGPPEPPIEIEMRGLDGTVVAIATRGVPITDQGRPAIQVVIEDISERKRLERELREAEARWRRLFEHAPIGLLVHQSGRYQFANAAAARILGAREPSELVGRDPFEIVTSPHHSTLRERLACLLERGETVPAIELELRRLDGELVTVEAVGTPITLGGRPAALMAIADVTERKRAEQALREAEARWRTLLELSPEAVLLIRDGVYVFANHRAVELFGARDASEVVGLRPQDVIDEPFWPVIEERGRQLLERGGTVPPLEIRIRRLDGMLLDVETSGAAVEDGGRRIIQTVLRDISERKRLEAELRRLAYHDPLTGLPNRALFFDRLNQALRHSEREGRYGAVMLLDLDGFKEVNDSFGHDAGDALLRGVARRLLRAVRRSDTVARLGGDEFALLLYPIADARVPERVGQRIAAAFGVPIRHRGHKLFARGSLGAALFPADGTSAEALLKQADVALYRAKARGRGEPGQVRLPGTVELDERNRLARELQEAIGTGAVAVLFEPRFDLRTGRVVAVEVSPRVEHARLGSIGAAELVRLAAEHGLTLTLVEQMLDHSLDAWRTLEREVGTVLSLAVDLPRRLLVDEDVASRLAARIERSGLDPSRIWIELHETARDPRGGPRFDEAIARLRASGSRVLLDDFAVSQCCLRPLLERTVDGINVRLAAWREQSRDATLPTLIRTVLDLAKELDLVVTALGVEDETQAQTLAALGCHHGQGPLWSRPLGAAELAAWLRAREPPPCACALGTEILPRATGSPGVP